MATKFGIIVLLIVALSHYAFQETTAFRFHHINLRSAMSGSESDNFLSKFDKQVGPLSSVDFIRIWKHYDTDKSGFIETEEDGSNEFRDFVKDFLQAEMGITESTAVEAKMGQLMFNDWNIDGKFQFSEMIELLPFESNFMAQFNKNNIGQEDFSQIFQHYDQDNSGKVEGDEIDGLIHDLIRLDEGDDDLTMDIIVNMKEALFDLYDMEKDGKFDKSELKEVLEV